jgi:hypothetical protein
MPYMLPATKNVRFFYYFKGKQRTAFVAGSIQGETDKVDMAKRTHAADRQ